ncbi:MAG: SDR family oxidoreductase [Deltaproteobacteria bacterium]|nr:SDR family oxidoreductase [Deltaproteobacteria bacterium]
MELGLSGRVALVTGASSGIGFSIASELVREGAAVFVASRSLPRVQQAVEKLRGVRPGAVVHGKVADLTDESQIKDLVSQINKTSPAHIIVINTGGPPAGSTLELTTADWDRGYSELLRSALLLTQLTVPAMKENGWGRILIVTSTSAREVMPFLPISSTFRAGLSAWTKGLAKEVGRYGILVNNLLPGPTNTTRLQELLKKSPSFLQSITEQMAVGRIGEPEEIGRVAAFLCSAANSFVTGTDVLVDGGYTCAL